MITTQSLRRVPWTCKWGRFGGPVPHGETAPGFVFWVCGHPDAEGKRPRLLDRGACEDCPAWESVATPEMNE